MDKDKVVLEDVEVVEKPRKATPKTKKIIAKGIYTGIVEIEYIGDAFDNSKIVRVK